MLNCWALSGSNQMTLSAFYILVSPCCSSLLIYFWLRFYIIVTIWLMMMKGTTLKLNQVNDLNEPRAHNNVRARSYSCRPSVFIYYSHMYNESVGDIYDGKLSSRLILKCTSLHIYIFQNIAGGKKDRAITKLLLFCFVVQHGLIWRVIIYK